MTVLRWPDDFFPDTGDGKCLLRRMGFINCSCARFDDGSCVPADVLPEFRRRRDASAPGDRAFADRCTYEVLDTIRRRNTSESAP